MTLFTPWSALFGGLIIGFAAILLLLFNGRVAGISGMIYASLSNNDNQYYWRWLFIIGLILGGWFIAYLDFPLVDHIDTSWPTLLIAGLLVGIGSRLGSGCTSGHAICGIGRLSKRSIIATIIFVCVAACIVFIRRHLLGE